MKKFFALIFPLTFALIAMAQNPTNDAADKGLATFKKLALLQPSKENPVNAADTSSLRLGTPLQTQIVPLDKLKAYKAGDATGPVITAIDEIVYPVINTRTNRIAGSVTVGKTKETWTAIRFGAENQLLQESAAGFLVQNDRKYSLVKILALQLSFLSYEENGNTLFIPLQNDANKNIPVGRAVEAKAVLNTYAQELINYNGLPM